MTNPRVTKPATTKEKSIPHIPLPFEEVMRDVLKVKPPKKFEKKVPKMQKKSE